MTNKWEFFLSLPLAERQYLINQFPSPELLDSAVDELRDHALVPTATKNQNDLALHEYAGATADGYKGGGWMQIRAMLVDYHLRMRALGL